MNALLLILSAALCNSVAVALLKISGNQLRLYSGTIEFVKETWILLVAAMALYLLAFILTVKLFSVSTFSRAVPVYVGMNIMFSLAIAAGYFKETLPANLMLGSVLIVAGILLVYVSPT